MDDGRENVSGVNISRDAQGSVSTDEFGGANVIESSFLNP